MEISAGEFKAKCLKLMDEVARTREPLTITKRGKPVARLVPPEETTPRASILGYMAGTAKILGDIVNVPHDAWAAQTGEEDHLYTLAEPSAPYRPQNSKAKARGKAKAKR